MNPCTIENTALIVPTLNAGDTWPAMLDAINEQTFLPKHRLVIDSASTDNTQQIAKTKHFKVHAIQRKDFNHGGTRQAAMDLVPDADYIIYLTQDATLADKHSLANLIQSFNDGKTGVCYGRQLPYPNHSALAAHARLYNYKDQSYVYSLQDAKTYGPKIAFNSNSFSAYRRSALENVGGFPSHLILSEDMYTAAKMLLKGYKIAYQAEAMVYHSHDYTPWQEFKRYFDTGVFHHRENWIRSQFGSFEGEGLKFVKSELAYLFKHQPWKLAVAPLHTAFKYFGYRCGLLEHYIPRWFKYRVSMHRFYWEKLSDY